MLWWVNFNHFVSLIHYIQKYILAGSLYIFAITNEPSRVLNIIRFLKITYCSQDDAKNVNMLATIYPVFFSITNTLPSVPSKFFYRVKIKIWHLRYFSMYTQHKNEHKSLLLALYLKPNMNSNLLFHLFCLFPFLWFSAMFCK